MKHAYRFDAKKSGNNLSHANLASEPTAAQINQFPCTRGRGALVNTSECFLKGTAWGFSVWSFMSPAALVVPRSRWFRLPLLACRVRRWFWSFRGGFACLNRFAPKKEFRAIPCSIFLYSRHDAFSIIYHSYLFSDGVVSLSISFTLRCNDDFHP